MIRKSSGLVAGLLTAAIFLFLCGSASADDYHYTNLLIGDRASGMGGAYTAVADDATGLYYNPAGAAYATGRSISASVNAYYSTEKVYKNVIGGNDWVRESSSLLPNYFGVVQPAGKFKVGISYAVPDSIMEDQDQSFTDINFGPTLQQYNPGAKIATYIINFNNESSSLNFGPSIAVELSESLSTGLTLYYYERTSQWILNQEIKTNLGGYEWTNNYFEIEEWGIRPVLGFMWAPVDTVSVGLSVSNIVIQGSNTKIQYSYRRENIAFPDPSTGNVISNVISMPDAPSSYGEKRKYPYQIGLGLAWFPSQSLLVSADINHYTAVHYTVVRDYDFEAVTNFSLGAEYYLAKAWAMRAGFFTDFANTQKISKNDIDQDEHIDLYGATLSLSHFTRNTSVTLGAGYTYGEGDAQIVGGINQVQDVTSEGLMLFLSSSFSY